MSPDRNHQTSPDYYLQIDGDLVPRHLAGLYGRMGMTALAIDLIGDLFVDVEDYEAVKAGALADFDNRDPRYDEALLRRQALVDIGREL
ncbi:MAG: hypothetical protein WDN66_04270 [Candidatus Saccharibacteria bacterium]